MRIVVINFSGNVGKSTVANELLLPRMPGAKSVSVESVNSSGSTGVVIRGRQYGQLLEGLGEIDGSAVVDVGASNVEDFMVAMQRYRESHYVFDLFVVPVVAAEKQFDDSIRTIQALNAVGVEPDRIMTVCNRLDAYEKVDEAFYPIIAFHEEGQLFRFNPAAAIQFNEVYQLLRANQSTISQVIADKTDYKRLMREASTSAERVRLMRQLALRGLAMSAKDNLDAVFSTIEQEVAA